MRKRGNEDRNIGRRKGRKEGRKINIYIYI